MKHGIPKVPTNPRGTPPSIRQLSLAPSYFRDGQRRMQNFYSKTSDANRAAGVWNVRRPSSRQTKFESGRKKETHPPAVTRAGRGHRLQRRRGLSLPAGCPWVPSRIRLARQWYSFSARNQWDRSCATRIVRPGRTQTPPPLPNSEKAENSPAAHVSFGLAVPRLNCPTFGPCNMLTVAAGSSTLRSR